MHTVVAAALAAALALVGLPACSASGGAPGRPAGAGHPSPGRHRPEQYHGDLEGFYRVPRPLPKGRPGDLIRVQDIGASAGHASVRVMYHSVDAAGTDRAVTGVVTYPTGPPPAGGWPVISTAHGTTGVASICAPSRTATEAPGWGVPGVWAMTDYIGLGPLGEIHPYLSKTAEGNAVIDIVRAARRLPATHAGRRWISIGHSQGGHGALSAHELARRHAPELHLVATVALAPGAMLERVYGGIDPIVTAILTMMGVYGGRSEHPDIDIRDYLTPQALAAAKVFDTGCLDEITNALIPVAVAGAFTHDPRTTEPARSIILANDVGHHPVRGVPVFMASGTKDDRVVIDRFLDLGRRMCAAGQVTEIHVVDGADHGSILPATSAQVTRFITGALAGHRPTNSCTEPPDRW
jgi:Secretory lipase